MGEISHNVRIMLCLTSRAPWLSHIYPLIFWKVNKTALEFGNSTITSQQKREKHNVFVFFVQHCCVNALFGHIELLFMQTPASCICMGVITKTTVGVSTAVVRMHYWYNYTAQNLEFRAFERNKPRLIFSFSLFGGVSCSLGEPGHNGHSIKATIV